MRWCGHSVFKNRKLSSSYSLSWKLALKQENPAQVLLTWLLQGEKILLNWSSVGETVKPRSLKLYAMFRLHTPWRTLSKKKRFSVALRERDDCPVLFTYTKHPQYLTIIRCADLYRLRSSVLRRVYIKREHASTNTWLWVSLFWL